MGNTVERLSKALQRASSRLQRDRDAKLRQLRKSLAPVIKGTGAAGAQILREAEKQIEAITNAARKDIRQAMNAAADSLERTAKKL